MATVHQLARFSCTLFDTYLNKEDTGRWCRVVIHIDCHKDGCGYNEDQDENPDDETGMKGSSFLLGCTVICRGWKSRTAVRHSWVHSQICVFIEGDIHILNKVPVKFFFKLSERLFFSATPILEVRCSFLGKWKKPILLMIKSTFITMF